MVYLAAADMSSFSATSAGTNNSATLSANLNIGDAASALNLPSSSADKRFERIATVAYFKAEAPSFEPGQKIDDWLAA